MWIVKTMFFETYVIIRIYFNIKFVLFQDWKWLESNLLLVRIEEDSVLTQATPIPAQVFPQPHEVLVETNKKEKFSSTKSGNRGYLIDSVHLSLLVSSDHKHFNNIL